MRLGASRIVRSGNYEVDPRKIPATTAHGETPCAMAQTREGTATSHSHTIPVAAERKQYANPHTANHPDKIVTFLDMADSSIWPIKRYS